MCQPGSPLPCLFPAPLPVPVTPTGAGVLRVEIAESLALKDSATEAFKAQDYDKAIEDLSAAIALDPTNQALEDADECIRLQPTWAKGYSRRAAAKFHLGDLQSAKLSYSKAWDLEPANGRTKADLEHVLSEIAGMKVVLPDRN
ncbi:MAG: hypothetical protein SGPRY_003391 [Prymnesium sp.]